jgi:prenyltransferase beta subunit
MWTTLLAAVLLTADDPVSQNQAAIAFLRAWQAPSGGFVTVLPPKGAEPRPSLRTTRTAIKTFRLLGGQLPNRDAVIRYLRACHDPTSGGFCDRPGTKPDAISTAVGLMILCELKLPVEPYLEAGLKFMNGKTEDFEEIRMVAPALEQLGRRVPRVDAWLATIDRARNADGSYGRAPGLARTTALYVMAQLRLGGEPESSAAVLKILREGQREDGGFGGDRPGGSDLEACYRVVRAITRLGAMPDRPEKSRTFIAACRNADGGFGVRPGQPSSLHGTYYATIVRHWLDGGK